jgi:PAS domain S-box-containing protein
MAMRGLLRGLSGKETAGGNAVRPIAMADDASRLQLLDEFEAAGIGWLWATDEQNRLTYLSPSAAASFGVAHEDLIGRPLASLFTLEDETGEEATERPLPFLLSARNKFANMTVRVDAGEETRWWTISGRPCQGPDGNYLGYRGGARDITADYERQRDNSRAAQYDSLTGLAAIA